MRAAFRFGTLSDVIVRRAAWLALALGLGHALVSAYWGSGGTWLLGTLGGTLEDAARRGGVGVAVTLWGVAAVKVIAAVLPVLATRPRIRHRRKLRLVAWIEACVLTGYGLALTSVGLLVQAGIVSSTGADHHALAWHTYLWDPWFLLWGLLCIVALRSPRRLYPVQPPALTRNANAPVTVR
jgi:Protein of unknown function (DUF3995)